MQYARGSLGQVCQWLKAIYLLVAGEALTKNTCEKHVLVSHKSTRWEDVDVAILRYRYNSEMVGRSSYSIVS